jgi:hypothetical protein
LSFLLAIAPGVPVPEGFSFVGDFSCLGLTVKTDISIAVGSFLIKLDLTQAARFGLILKALGMGKIELPDWLADTGFSRVLLVSYSLLGTERIPEGLHIQGGVNVFGLEGYVDFGACRESTALPTLDFRFSCRVHVPFSLRSHCIHPLFRALIFSQATR